MKLKSDEHEEQTSGQNSKYRTEHRGNREGGYTHTEGPWDVDCENVKFCWEKRSVLHEG